MNKIFISYSNRDQEWKDRLVSKLKALANVTGITFSTDNRLAPESVAWGPDEEKELREAKIVIMLISPNFLDSDIIMTKEVPLALDLQEEKGVHIIPLLIKNCPWRKTRWFANIQTFPENARPLEEKSDNQIEALLDEVAQHIMKLLQDIPDTPSPRPPKSPSEEVQTKDSETKKEETANAQSFKNILIPGIPDIHDMDHKPAIGVNELAEELADFLAHQKSDKPLMVGIFGQWGRGKTFLMEQIWKALGNKKNNEALNFERVDFHAWKYQDTPASWAYLYEAFTETCFRLPKWEEKDFLSRYLKSKLRNLWRILKVNVKRHGWYILFTFALSVLVSIVFHFISWEVKKQILLWVVGLPIFTILLKLVFFYRKKAVQLFKKYTRNKDFKELMGMQKEIQDELKMLLETWIPPRKLAQNKKILLFVDDLDRCREERLIQVIDSLRVMLEDEEINQRVIALIAVDERILTRAVRFKYQKLISENNSKEKGKQEETGELSISELTIEYLDKLFLLGIKLNPLNEPNKQEILDAIAGDKVTPMTDDERRTRGSVTQSQESPEQSTDISALGSNKDIRNSSEAVDQFPEKKIYYKLDNSFFTKKEIKKLPRNVLEKLEGLKGKVYSEEDLLAALEYLNIRFEVTVEINQNWRYQPDLNWDEYEDLRNLLPLLDNATPRSIRILYYRYILAKRLLERDQELYAKIFPNKDTSSSTPNQTNGLLILLFLATLYRSPHHMKELHGYFSTRDFDTLEKDLEKMSPGNNQEYKSLISNIKQWEQDVPTRILRILEIVVAY